ncbi:DUF4157 domain-containing protein [Variovorax sp. YR216]|uniref:eCIS core domain-containing protein n=1 Tax=Variovorax sp. YR216 TaxID=1882828 RepID=UPI000B8846B2|nr:DUF4157 domain-containing protein [Variovorax sp. YR216]
MLRVSSPSDAEELEADRDAQRVTQTSEPSRARSGTTRERDPDFAPASVSQVLASAGRPLDADTRAYMEPRFGHDLSAVRVHDDAASRQTADQLHADAYTVGRHIVFGPQQYAPGTSAGRWLLAHELSHVTHDGATPRVHRQPQRTAPPPVAGGNVLYVGMNNYGPEVAQLATQYTGTSVKITKVTLSEHEEKTVSGGATYDLTQDSGIKAFAAAQSLDAAHTATLEALLKSQSSSDRDDLAHVIAVYSACEKDGVDRMSRVVLSGHSYGTKVYNEDAKGAILFDALVSLAGIFPKAAAQTRHLIVLACMAAEESTIKTYYLKAFPNLKTVSGWTSTCPTGAGAASALGTWASRTDADPTKLPAPPQGQANWALGNFQSGDPVDPVALMAALRADDAKFADYFAGTKVDPNSHSGPLTDYYHRARSAEQQSAITGADHTYAATHADQSFRLRFWPGMASGFWKKYGATVTKGYGSAKVPGFATMSRKDALAAIAKFDADATGATADKAEAKKLLTSLLNLDPTILSDNWFNP